MAQQELIMPKMGESIMEATILKWVKNVGDSVALDETILEIATDKVDSEIPSPVEGVISKILFNENDTVEVGKVIAIIATEGEEPEPKASPAIQDNQNGTEEKPAKPVESVSAHSPQKQVKQPATVSNAEPVSRTGPSGNFYSPLVRNIAQKEGLSLEELDTIKGSGLNGRVTKKDILGYLEDPARTRQAGTQTTTPRTTVAPALKPETISTGTSLSTDPGDQHIEIIEMDRMRRLIADHMVMSKHTSPHVTSFVEVDVSNIVEWRNEIKDQFAKKHQQKITFTPIFIEAVVKALLDFPMVNISLDGNNIIVKKDINIGLATALPSGNLIVPVIRNADSLNLIGLTRAVNDLANRARSNNLKPEEIQGGTFTLTNVGTFGNVMGTPIINQPQVAIMATGAIRKKPAVLETDYGDVIGIRQMMFLSLSYDHRVVDGFLGGSFLRKVGDYLESFDVSQKI
jgi:2-oxoglutarate dehydrogenase E2 component (dihydrolipoamide succinyltransferase)